MGEVSCFMKMETDILENSWKMKNTGMDYKDIQMGMFIVDNGNKVIKMVKDTFYGENAEMNILENTRTI
jgi:hypothetical protein